jgi:tetratricopeptide (TPR) repeat protein
VYEIPLAAKQSLSELEITRIEITNSETIISLIVTNKLSSGGWFCADKNIYIKNSKGDEIYQLVKSENIPTCPDQFEFAYAGQTLEFNLYFDKISDNIKFIDLIENCENSCFSFYGIILDNNHNENIRAFENGFELFQNNEFDKSVAYFEKVLEGQNTIESHIYGLSYYYLILIYNDKGNKEKVNSLYNELLSSTIAEKETFINELKNKINIQ